MPKLYQYQSQSSPVSMRTPNLPAVPAVQAHEQASKLLGQVQNFGERLISALGKEYVADQTAKVDDALLNATNKYDIWNAYYKKENQGALALNAAEEYAQAYQTISEEALQEFGGKDNEVFKDTLKQRLHERGVYAVRDGLQWQMSERQRFLNSQWDTQVEKFKRFVEVNAGNSAAIEQEAAALKGSFVAKNPGMDHGKVFMQIDDMILDNQMEHLLKTGQTGKAQALLDQQIAKYSQGRQGNQGNQSKPPLSKEEAIGKIRTITKNFIQENEPEANASTVKLGSQSAQIAPQNNAPQNNAPSEPKVTIDPELSRQVKEFAPGYALYSKPISQSTNKPISKSFEINPPANMPVSSNAYSNAGNSGNSGNTGNAASTAPVRSFRGYEVQGKLGEWQNKIESVYKRKEAMALNEFMGNIKKFIADSGQGIIAKFPYSEEVIRKRLGENAPAIIAAMYNASEYAQHAGKLNNLAPEQMPVFLQAMTPDPNSANYKEDMARFVKLQKATDAMKKEFEQDPAAYVMRRSPDMVKAFEEWRANPTAENFESYARLAEYELQTRGGAGSPILAKPVIQNIASIIRNANDPVLAFAELRGSTGKYAGQMVSMLTPELSGKIKFMAYLSPEAGRLLMQTVKEPKFRERTLDALNIKGVDKTDFENKVTDSVRGISRSLLTAAQDNTGLVELIKESVGDLALQYVRTQGSRWSMDKCITQAANDIINNRYNIVEQKRGGGPLHVPTKYDAEAVASGMENWLRNADMTNINAAYAKEFDKNTTEAAYKDHIAQSGVWVTSADESGAHLLVMGRVVYDKNGKALLVPWQKFIDMSKTIDADEYRPSEIARENQNTANANNSVNTAQGNTQTDTGQGNTQGNTQTDISPDYEELADGSTINLNAGQDNTQGNTQASGSSASTRHATARIEAMDQSEENIWMPVDDIAGNIIVAQEAEAQANAAANANTNAIARKFINMKK